MGEVVFVGSYVIILLIVIGVKVVNEVIRSKMGDIIVKIVDEIVEKFLDEMLDRVVN